jgi:hypothetical protein
MVKRPLERNRLVRSSAGIERQRWQESLEIEIECRWTDPHESGGGGLYELTLLAMAHNHTGCPATPGIAFSTFGPTCLAESEEGIGMFKPWIGSEYAATRLLILGESAYSWWEDDQLRHPSLSHSVECVRWAIHDFPNCGRFFGMVSRALAATENPDGNRLEAVWGRVAFTNYVSVTVGDGSRIPPASEMWKTAKREFLPGISNLFNPTPRRVVILGKTMWSKMPETDVFITDDVQGYTLADGVMMCWATCHPAGGLSWRELANIIHFTYERHLRA